MKKNIFLIIALFLSLGTLFSQPSNFIFNSENAYPFYVMMNGVKQNQNFQTNVRVENLTEPSYKVKIVFKDKTLPSLNKNIYTKAGMEIAYIIKKNRKGENVLRYNTETPISYEPVIIADNRNNNDTVVISDETIDNNSSDANIDNNKVDEDASLNTNVDVNGENVSYDESVVLDATNVYIEDNIEAPIYKMPGYNGDVGCHWPIENKDFQLLKQTIENTDFKLGKLKIAKIFVDSKCFTAQQVKEIVLLFNSESSKLDIAKYAYKHTFDINNYHIINDTFDLPTSIKALDDYKKTVSWK